MVPFMQHYSCSAMYPVTESNLTQISVTELNLRFFISKICGIKYYFPENKEVTVMNTCVFTFFFIPFFLANVLLFSVLIYTTPCLFHFTLSCSEQKIVLGNM